MEITQFSLYGCSRLTLKLELDLDVLEGLALVRVTAKDPDGGALLALRQRDFTGWFTPKWWTSELAVLVSQTVEDLTEPFPTSAP